MGKAKGKSRAEIKAELLALAESRIEEVLGMGEQGERPTLSAIETRVLQIRDELSVKLAEAVLHEQEKGQLVPGPRCEQCGEEMAYKDSHGLKVTSWVGELQLERGYYYCAACQRGLFPPGRATTTLR
jgi:hypothetical protein